MLIGYDASRAFIKEKTGTETYSFQLLKALLDLDSSRSFRIYARSELPITNYQLLINAKCQMLNDKCELVFINWPYLWTQGGLALETWKNPPDVLFIPAHVVPLLKKPKVPVVVAVHDLGLEYLPYYSSWKERLYLGWFMERLRARLATHIIAVSEATKKDVVEKLHVPEGKVSVVYEGVDLSNYKLRITNYEKEKVKRKYGIKGEYILFVGTVQPRKNLVRLIEAFSLLITQLPNYPITLLIAGKPGWDYEKIYAAPKKFGVEGRVKFLGYILSKDLPNLYAGAKVFCLPSLHEGFGLPVLEAMAAETPVIVSRASSLPEVGGDVAVYVDPYDVADIARGISAVLSWDESARLDSVGEGRKWAAQFTWEKAARETLKILEQAAQ